MSASSLIHKLDKNTLAKIQFDRNSCILSTEVEKQILPEMLRAEVLHLYDIEKHKLDVVPGGDGHNYFVGYAETQVVLCEVELTDGSRHDPCMIYPVDVDFENLKGFEFFALASDIKKIVSSPRKLPNEIIDASRNTGDFKGSAHALIARAKGKEIAIRAFSNFYDHDGILGRDVEPVGFRSSSQFDGDSCDQSALIIFADIENLNKLQRLSDLEKSLSMRQTIRDPRFMSKKRPKKRG